MEECPETLAFATEPVHASLAHLISATQASELQGSGRQANTPTSQAIHINGPDAHPVFLDVELKYGILQVYN